LDTAQDAAEYFQHLLEVMSRSERAAAQRLGAPSAAPTAAAFQFAIEDRIECGESGRVSYTRTPANMLALDIDVHAATNRDELEEYQVREGDFFRVFSSPAREGLRTSACPFSGSLV
jgi:ubiquitin carboxyl-terminal hydrolase 5/13